MVRISDANKWFAKDVPSPKDTTIKEAYKAGFLRGMTEMYMHPLRAHWVFNWSLAPLADGINLYTCSNCGESDSHRKDFNVPYCWNCGTKMEDKNEY